MANSGGAVEPTLLIKANTLILKALVLGASLQIVAKLRPHDKLLVYGVKIYDDPNLPVLIWSAIESIEEVNAFEQFLTEQTLPVFLFNELALNVMGSRIVRFKQLLSKNNIPVREASLGIKMNRGKQAEIEKEFQAYETASDKYWDTKHEPSERFEWYQVENNYIANSLYTSKIQFLDKDEGGQNEELALWLCDEFSLSGVAINPMVGEGASQRELCDVFFGYENGTFLIESKSISLFSRVKLPVRENVHKSIEKKIHKGVKQLSGACRRLKGGETITFQGREVPSFEKDCVPHCIVLVNDLEDLNQVSSLTIDTIKKFSKKSGGMLHFLDLSNLLRLVQGAHLHLQNGNLSLLHYFDYLLVERWNRTIKSGKPVIHMLIHNSAPDK